VAKKTVRIIFAGGGTGGHLFPAIAIADRITELAREDMNVEISFAGTRRGLEYRMRDKLGYPLHLINIRGIARSLSLRNLLVPFIAVGALVKANRLIRQFRPDLVVGTGGYVSWPMVRVAAAKGIYTVLQEQNSYPGLTTRRLAGHVRKIYLGFKAAELHLSKKPQLLVTGNPVRREIMQGNREDALRQWSLEPNKKTILILGGSQGARTINRAIIDALNKRGLGEDYQLLWQTGKRDYKDVVAEAGNKVTGALFPFAENMAQVYAVADIAIVRAGALTLAELMACAIPSILIPYPHAAGDHQKKNAQDLVERSLAVMIEESNLAQHDLLEEAASILSTEKGNQMKKQLKQEQVTSVSALDKISKDILDIVAGNDRPEKEIG